MGAVESERLVPMATTTASASSETPKCFATVAGAGFAGRFMQLKYLKNPRALLFNRRCRRCRRSRTIRKIAEPVPEDRRCRGCRRDIRTRCDARKIGDQGGVAFNANAF